MNVSIARFLRRICTIANFSQRRSTTETLDRNDPPVEFTIATDVLKDPCVWVVSTVWLKEQVCELNGFTRKVFQAQRGAVSRRVHTMTWKDAGGL